MGNASRQNTGRNQARRRLPLWVRLGISGRASTRLDRRAAYLRVCTTIVVGVVAITVGSLREGGFLLVWFGLGVWCLSAYLLAAIRWLDRRKAWRWP